MEKSRKPKIRFKGYNDDWEQRELGELASSFEYGLNAASKCYDGINKYIRITDIDDETRTFLDTDLTSPDCDLSLSENYLLKDGDILFARTGASAGKTFIYKAFNGVVYYAGFLIRARLKENCSPQFVFYNTLTKEYEKFIRVTSQRSGQPGVNAHEYATFELLLPKYDEQCEIGKFFTNLDYLITLHQRKLEKLMNVKKSMLEKMFPKQGSTVPEIRFNGFTQAWEQREFSEMFDCTISNNTLSRSELSYEEGSILNIHYGDILIKYGSILDIHKYKIPRIPNEKKEDFRGSLLQPGDIVIADTAEDETTGKACEIGNLFGNSIVAGLHTMVARPNIEMASGYLGYYLNSNAYHCQLLPMMQGIKVLSLSRANVKKTALKFPESTKEQQLIANYFIQLDELITLHQRKLEKLKNIKKSMLEKMFI